MIEIKQNSPAGDWLEAELADTLDEDYKLEISEPALSMEIAKIYKNAHPPSIDRLQYFRDLIMLQSELIKLQSWVAYHKKKLVVVFEGRDSAGKGGAPWFIVEGNDKKRARLNCIDQLLKQMPYEEVPHEEIILPERVFNPEYERQVLPRELYVPEKY
ncbi:MULTISPECIES: hypothetical protein [unclassified Mesorhizobium]|uniref:hypothetical protein n=1 Tax=unclassified Mesorhizobium TaxID=325217 RepID=UPI00333AA49A